MPDIQALACAGKRLVDANGLYIRRPLHIEQWHWIIRMLEVWPPVGRSSSGAA
jgi:hypothetical protein